MARVVPYMSKALCEFIKPQHFQGRQRGNGFELHGFRLEFLQDLLGLGNFVA